MQTEFTTFDICKIFGVKYGRLREWVDGGYLKPSIQEANGQGTKNLFSFNDVVRIYVFVTARGYEISRAGAAVISQKCDIESQKYSIELDLTDIKNQVKDRINAVT